MRFSVARHAAWSPGVSTPEAWRAWAQAPFKIEGTAQPALAKMPAMLRRRAGFLGKMALEVAYDCLDGRSGVPTVFCSRHGEAARAIELLTELTDEMPLSPTGFGLAVHNASAGLFSIARADQANHVALAAGACTVEHAVIEACGMLADGVPMVLLVAYDCPLPEVLSAFEDCAEQPHAWAWLMVPAGAGALALHWSADDAPGFAPDPTSMPGGLEVLRFYMGGAPRLERRDGRLAWRWTRDD
ncbi:beta-ketoacyl synthase chain length factor [Massilia glaciei]|uniref:beta-ketoacyl synthase chain length factor n=1 Tax=Massilia glaciei TaxID=1524097 RepID=UPI001E585E44|nr:beta-ketoacyl synthase chain length factor [Massilia glaciei]